MARTMKHGTTSVILRFTLKDASDGQPVTGFDESTSGLIISTIADVEATPTVYTVAAGNVEAISTLGTWSAPTASKCRFGEVDATNHPGLYEFQFANARFAVANATALVVTVSGAAGLLVADYEIAFVQYNPQSATNLGLSGIPTAAPGAANGMLIVGANSGAMSITNSAGAALTLISAGSNGPALWLLGNGSGAGLRCDAGASGAGMRIRGGSTSGHGVDAAASTDGEGLLVTGVGSGRHGLKGVAGTNGAGVRGEGNGSGAGVSGVGGTSGPGIHGLGGGAAAGLHATGGSSNGPGIKGSAGATNAAGLRLEGAGTGGGLETQAGNFGAAFKASGGIHAIQLVGPESDSRTVLIEPPSSGDTISVQGGAAGGHAVTLQGGETAGRGLNIVGGSTGAALGITGGSTSGDGISIGVTDGDEINAVFATQIQDLVNRLTEVRADLLDKLAISGLVAGQDEVLAIQNNTRVVRSVPTVIERPDSGTQTYRIELLLYDAVGNMEAPDGAPTLALVDQGGTDLSSRLDSATGSAISTGRYRWIYTATNTDDLEQLNWTFSVVEGGATRLYTNTSLIVDTTAVDFTAADRTKLDTLHDTRLTAARATALDLLDAAISSRASQTSVNTLAGYVDTEVAQIITLLADLATVLTAAQAIQAKTDQLTFTAGNLHARMMSAVQAALALFVTLDTGETIAVDGSVGKIAQGSAGGNVTVGSMTNAALRQFVTDNTTESAAAAGSVAKLSQGAGGGASVILGAITAVKEPANRVSSPILLEMFQEESKAFALSVLDAAGDPVDLSGLTLRFVVHDANKPTASLFDVEQGSIVVSGDSNEVATVTVPDTAAADANLSAAWKLWDVTAKAVLLWGPFRIHPAVLDHTP